MNPIVLTDNQFATEIILLLGALGAALVLFMIGLAEQEERNRRK